MGASALWRNTPPKVQFVVAGFMKCGTTSLWRMLSQHPQIHMHGRKCANYWAIESVALTPWLGARTYDAMFEDAPEDRLIGEASASYVFYPHALLLLRRYNPQLKLIISMRHPVDRAFSHWNMNRRKGRDGRSFEEAMALARKWPMVGERRYFFSYIARGLYARQSETLLRIFPRDQVHFLRQEDLARDRQATLRGVAEFLGLAYVDAMADVEDALVGEYASALDPTVRAQLIGDYRTDILRLERLLDWDLSDWLSPETAPSAQAPA